MRQNNRPYIIGVTGGIGSGKSTASQMLAEELGAFLIDADALSREVISYEKAEKRVKESFGEDLYKDGILDRKALGDIIFSDPVKRAVLNGIIHPLVRERFLELVEENLDKDFIVYDCPLLIEADLQEDVDVTVLIYVDEDTQMDRLMNRDGLDRKSAYDRICAQMPLEEKIPLSDIVIYNDSTLETLRERTSSEAEKFRASHGSQN